LSGEWRDHAKTAGYKVVGSGITVNTRGGRRQEVQVDESVGADGIRLWSVILGPSATRDLDEGRPLEYAWERNRLSDLIGFSVDSRGRLIGESWVPVDGLTAQVFALHLGEIARVCDWHELRLSGADTY
jgi:hypothetical protein